MRPPTLRQIIDQAYMEALERNHWNRTHACRELDISIRTMRNWVIRMEQDGRPLPRPTQGPHRYRGMCCVKESGIKKPLPRGRRLPVGPTDVRKGESQYCRRCGLALSLLSRQRQACTGCEAPLYR